MYSSPHQPWQMYPSSAARSKGAEFPGCRWTPIRVRDPADPSFSVGVSGVSSFPATSVSSVPKPYRLWRGGSNQDAEYFKSCLLFMCAGTHALQCASRASRRASCGQLFSHARYVLGIRLRLSDLTADAFTHWGILLAPASSLSSYSQTLAVWVSLLTLGDTGCGLHWWLFSPKKCKATT